MKALKFVSLAALSTLLRAESLVEIYDTMKIYDESSLEVKSFSMTSFPYINDVLKLSFNNYVL